MPIFCVSISIKGTFGKEICFGKNHVHRSLLVISHLLFRGIGMGGGIAGGGQACVEVGRQLCSQDS